MVPGTTDTGNHTDDGVTFVTLPFTFQLYGVNYTGANVSSNGNMQFVTTNTAFSEWGSILYNTTIATAIADRLVENSEIFLLGGDSWRKAKRASPSLLPDG